MGSLCYQKLFRENWEFLTLSLQLYKLNISCLLGFFGLGFLLIHIFNKCLPNAMHCVGCLRDTEILTEVYSLAEEANTYADHSKAVKRRMLSVSSVIH